MSLKKIIKNKIIKNILPLNLLEEPGFLYKTTKKELRKLKNIHKGKRCFIIGNGPSLNKLDLSKIQDEYTFGVNGIFYKTEEMGFYPTYYVVEDTHVMKDNVKEINEYTEPELKFFPSIYKKYIKNKKNVIFFNMNRGFYEPKSPKFSVPSFSVDASQKLFCGQSVTMINLQLAYYMGFKEVYLIGMDFSYNIPKSAIVNGKEIESTEDDNNHFNPNYFGKGKKWHDPQLDKVLLSYKFIKMMYEFDNRKIYNSTAGGKLEIFERVDYNSLWSN